MKFKIVSEKYFENAKIHLKLRTYLHYKLLYQAHLSPYFDEKKLNNITKKEVAKFFESLSDHSLNSIKLLYCVLKNIFNFGKNELNLKINLDLSLKFKSSKTKVEALTIKEQQVLEKFIIESKNRYRYGIIIALYTGLRIGELLALTWKDVDFKRKVIKVNKITCEITKEGRLMMLIDCPKTPESIREIPLTSILISLLREMKTYQKNKSEYVVSTHKGKAIRVRSYQKAFANTLKDTGLKHYGFHSLRHTFATRAIECGVDVKTLSEILGHSSVNITLSRYVHSSFELKKRLIDKVAKNFNIKNTLNI